jgi:hypothetical protein
VQQLGVALEMNRTDTGPAQIHRDSIRFLVIQGQSDSLPGVRKPPLTSLVSPQAIPNIFQSNPCILDTKSIIQIIRDSVKGGKLVAIT